NTTEVVGTSAQASMLATAQRANVTDLYIYLDADAYDSEGASLRTFISAAADMNIFVWGLDGARTYFSDASGPAPLYADIKSLIAFNASAQPNEQFVGFMADNEPNDAAGYTTFHDDIADSELSTAAGSGVWQNTQALDREMLMRDWLTIHKTAASMLHGANLRFGATMPFLT